MALLVKLVNVHNQSCIQGGAFGSHPPPPGSVKYGVLWGFRAPMTAESGKFLNTPLYTIQPIMAGLIFMSLIFGLSI